MITLLIEKFDDIKFGKVLTKLYARLFTMEQTKYLPPKFSFSLKDLTEYLGIYEITEDQIKKRGDMSESSSNYSYMTQSAFKPKNSQLDVIREHNTYIEEEEDYDGLTIGQKVKTGSSHILQPSSSQVKSNVTSASGATNLPQSKTGETLHENQSYTSTCEADGTSS